MASENGHNLLVDLVKNTLSVFYYAKLMFSHEQCSPMNSQLFFTSPQDIPTDCKTSNRLLGEIKDAKDRCSSLGFSLTISMGKAEA